MLEYCSPDLLRAYQQAKASRVEKLKEKSRTLKELVKYIGEDKSNPTCGKPVRNMEEVCTSLALKVANKQVTEIIPDCLLKNPNPVDSQSKKSITASKKPKSKTKFKKSNDDHTPRLEANNSLNELSNEKAVAPFGDDTGLDLLKIDDLFDTYDHILQPPPDSGGSGDGEGFCGEIPTQCLNLESHNFVESPEMIILKKKIEQEIEVLVKDVDGALELHDFVQKWTEVIKDVALGAKERQIEDEVRMQQVHDILLTPLCIDDDLLALPDLSSESVLTLDDVAAEELWRTSVDLIKNFRGNFLHVYFKKNIQGSTAIF
jgi:hypothetical protein